MKLLHSLLVRALCIYVVVMTKTFANAQQTEATNGNPTSNKTKLTIGAMIPLLYTHDFFTFHAAIKTAVRLINEDDSILKDYELDVHYYDSGVHFYFISNAYLSWSSFEISRHVTHWLEVITNLGLSCIKLSFVLRQVLPLNQTTLITDPWYWKLKALMTATDFEPFGAVGNLNDKVGSTISSNLL